MSSHQLSLFDDELALPPGAVYGDDFLSAAEETTLIELLRALPFEAAQYKGYAAKRRVVSYGGRFDYDANRLLPGPPLADALHPLRQKVADWMALKPDALAHVLVAEYAPGTSLGWHRDVPDFEDVAGVSLGSVAQMRFRPYPPDQPHARDIVRLWLAPRSIYRLSGPARWDWQHSVAPVPALRWSVTFRTLRARGRKRPPA